MPSARQRFGAITAAAILLDIFNKDSRFTDDLEIICILREEAHGDLCRLINEAEKEPYH